MSAQTAQLIELRVKASADKAPFLNRRGRFIDDRSFDKRYDFAIQRWCSAATLK
jgi:hypothetical protein